MNMNNNELKKVEKELISSHMDMLMFNLQTQKTNKKSNIL